MEAKVLEYMRRVLKLSWLNRAQRLEKPQKMGWKWISFGLSLEKTSNVRHLDGINFSKRHPFKSSHLFMGRPIAGEHCYWNRFQQFLSTAVSTVPHHQATESALQFSECLRQLAWCSSKSLRPSSSASEFDGLIVLIGWFGFSMFFQIFQTMSLDVLHERFLGDKASGPPKTKRLRPSWRTWWRMASSCWRSMARSRCLDLQSRPGLLEKDDVEDFIGLPWKVTWIPVNHDSSV